VSAAPTCPSSLDKRLEPALTTLPTQIDRFAFLLRVLGILQLKAELMEHLNLPHRMKFTRWIQGKLTPTQAQINGVISFTVEQTTKLGKPIKASDLTKWLETGVGTKVERQLTEFIPTSPLIELRERYGLNQKEAALLLGVSRMTMHTHERKMNSKSWFYKNAERVFEEWRQRNNG